MYYGNISPDIFLPRAAADRSLRWDTRNNDLSLECFTQHATSQHASDYRAKSNPNLHVYTHTLSIIIIIINLTHVKFRRLNFRHQDQVTNLAKLTRYNYGRLKQSEHQLHIIGENPQYTILNLSLLKNAAALGERRRVLHRQFCIEFYIGSFVLSST